MALKPVSTRTWEDVLSPVAECAITLWQIGMLVAVLPLVATIVAIICGAPLWLGYLVWSVTIDIYQRAVVPPELPVQLFRALGL